MSKMGTANPRLRVGDIECERYFHQQCDGPPNIMVYEDHCSPGGNSIQCMRWRVDKKLDSEDSAYLSEQLAQIDDQNPEGEQ